MTITKGQNWAIATMLALAAMLALTSHLALAEDPAPASPAFDSGDESPLAPPEAAPKVPPLATRPAVVPPAAVIPAPHMAPAATHIPPLPIPGQPALLPDSAPPPPQRAQHPAPPAWANDAAPSVAEPRAPVADTRTLTFAPGSATLPEGANASLQPLVTRLATSPEERLRIVAYASGAADDPVPARRLSLRRAIAVREAMIALGAREGRMDVHAMGEPQPAGATPEGTPDRVDITLDSVARAAEKTGK